MGTRLAGLLGLQVDYFEWSKDGLTPRGFEVAKTFDGLPEGADKDRLLAIIRLFAKS